MKNPPRNTFLSHLQIQSICVQPASDALFLQGLCSAGGKVYSDVFTISYRLFDVLSKEHLLPSEHIELSSCISDALAENKPRWYVFQVDRFLTLPFLLKNIGLHFDPNTNEAAGRLHIQRFTQIFDQISRT